MQILVFTYSYVEISRLEVNVVSLSQRRENIILDRLVKNFLRRYKIFNQNSVIDESGTHTRTHAYARMRTHA